MAEDHAVGAFPLQIRWFRLAQIHAAIFSRVDIGWAAWQDKSIEPGELRLKSLRMNQRKNHRLSAGFPYRFDLIAQLRQVPFGLLLRCPPGDAYPWSVGAVACHGIQHRNI